MYGFFHTLLTKPSLFITKKDSILTKIINKSDLH